MSRKGGTLVTALCQGRIDIRKASGQLVNNERKIADGAEPLKSTLRAESNKNL